MRGRHAALALLLGGCCPTAPLVPGGASLPPVAAYSEPFQQGLFQQLETAEPGTPLAVFVTDAIALRCAVQAARGDPVGTICAAPAPTR